MATTKDVEKVKFTDAELGALTDFESVGELLKSRGVPFESFEQYGTGFRVLDDKSKLIGVPFIILESRFSKGDKGEFCSLVIVTKGTKLTVGGVETAKLIINDGSTGIRLQMHEVIETRKEKGIDPDLPLWVGGGLRVSRYDYTDEKTGEVSKAETYYLSY